jgi:hypothetical protein
MVDMQETAWGQSDTSIEVSTLLATLIEKHSTERADRYAKTSRRAASVPFHMFLRCTTTIAPCFETFQELSARQSNRRRCLSMESSTQSFLARNIWRDTVFVHRCAVS